MAEENKPAEKQPAPAEKSPVQKYYDAPTREAKAAVVKQHPELERVFSAANHN